MRTKRQRGKAGTPTNIGIVDLAPEFPSKSTIADLGAPKVTTEQAQQQVKPQKQPVTVKPPQDRYSIGYKDGFARGLEEGKKLAESKLDLQITLATRNAFDGGVRHIVTLAEENLAKELHLSSRDELVSSGKLPSWWLYSLVCSLRSGKLPPVKMAKGENPKEIEVGEIEEEP